MAIRLSFGEFELDEARFELRRSGEAVEVQPKVLDLVFYLATHADRVVTKTELLDHVWPGVVVTEASLSQAVSAARRALGDDGAAQTIIRTVRGRGFRFTADTQDLGVQGAQHSAVQAQPPALGSPGLGPLGGAVSLGPGALEGPPSSMGTFESARSKLGATNASLELETHEESAQSERQSLLSPHLFVVCHADDPATGGARYALDGIDDVEIIRGVERGVVRHLDGATKRLVISIPGNLVSRRHAQLVRGHGDWQLIDLDSRNGSYVAGERIKKHALRDGDVFECGHTLFLFRAEMRTPLGLRPDADSRGMRHRALASLIPERQSFRHALSRIARSQLSVLISGESGSGKELAAREFHLLSGRTGELVAVSCGALGEHPEPALFGSSADAADVGYLQRASTGSLLLDQVESLSAAGQAALVRALDSQHIAPVGAAQSVPVDLRVIAATTGDLEELVKSGSFRADLYSRLSGYHLDLPALRERREDFGLVLGDVLKELGLGVKLAPEAARALLAYSWPGNIRELKQTLIAAAALAGLETISTQHLPAALLSATQSV